LFQVLLQGEGQSGNGQMYRVR